MTTVDLGDSTLATMAIRTVTMAINNLSEAQSSPKTLESL